MFSEEERWMELYIVGAADQKKIRCCLQLGEREGKKGLWICLSFSIYTLSGPSFPPSLIRCPRADSAIQIAMGDYLDVKKKKKELQEWMQLLMNYDN